MDGKLAQDFISKLENVIATLQFPTPMDSNVLIEKFWYLLGKIPKTKSNVEKYDFFLQMPDLRQIVDNIQQFIGKFAKKSHFRAPISAFLLEKCSPLFVKRIGLKQNTLKVARRRVRRDSVDTLFSTRYPIASFRESIPKSEVQGIKDWAMTVLTGKSGSAVESYYCSLTKEQLHEQYLETLPTVWGYIFTHMDDKDKILTSEQKLTRYEQNVRAFNRWQKLGKLGQVALVGGVI